MAIAYKATWRYLSAWHCDLCMNIFRLMHFRLSASKKWGKWCENKGAIVAPYCLSSMTWRQSLTRGRCERRERHPIPMQHSDLAAHFGNRSGILRSDAYRFYLHISLLRRRSSKVHVNYNPNVPVSATCMAILTWQYSMNQLPSETNPIIFQPAPAVEWHQNQSNQGNSILPWSLEITDCTNYCDLRCPKTKAEHPLSAKWRSTRPLKS